MPELTSSTREAARRIGVTETALRKAATTGRIVREADGQWDVEKTRRRLIETADPVRSPLAGMPVGPSPPGSIGTSAGAGSSLNDGTPFARLKVAELALHSGRFDGFCLVSSDSDFTRLASRLREQGADVYGFGEQKTPESFRQPCRRFIYTENLLPEAQVITTGEGISPEAPPFRS